MSLLIDALKRAERAKNGQPEPARSQPSGIERAVENANTSLDWAVEEVSTEPAIGEAAMDAPDVSARAEPTLATSVENVPLRQPLVSPLAQSAPASKLWASAKADNIAATKERAAAQTLFDAKRPPPRSRAGLLALLGLAALLLAGGGFYVWYSLAFPPSSVFTAVPPRRVAPSAEPVLTPSVVTVSPEVKPASSNLSTTAIAPTPAPVQPGAIVAPPAAATELEKSASAATLPPKPKPARRDRRQNAVDEPASSDDRSPAEIVQREVEQARRAQSARHSKNPPRNGAVQVGKGAQTGFDADIALAYSSLLSGDRAEAKRLYAIAAERDPFNTDALLGLATIAGNQGDLNAAQRYYRRALEVEPQNTSALAGLASIRQPGGPSESQLKYELARSPDSAPLQFALGNQFANQSRWDEAQQAYFEAFSMDTRNADYAYNLAVSLDQLNQTKQAINYYRKAIELAKVHGARFRSLDVTARLSELGQGQ